LALLRLADADARYEALAKRYPQSEAYIAEARTTAREAALSKHLGEDMMRLVTQPMEVDLGELVEGLEKEGLDEPDVEPGSGKSLLASDRHTVATVAGTGTPRVTAEPGSTASPSSRARRPLVAPVALAFGLTMITAGVLLLLYHHHAGQHAER
jgi:hypothetical protein